MKRKLLFAGLLLGTLCAHAQLNIGFETAEGYEPGDIFGQNGWATTFEGDLISVTAEKAKTGTQSLHITGGTAGPAAYLGARSPLITAPTTGWVEVSFDIFIDPLPPGKVVQFMITAPSIDPNADYGILFGPLYPDQENPLMFLYGNAADEEFSFAYTYSEWHNITIKHFFDSNHIEYFIDGTMFNMHEITEPEKIEYIAFLIDAGNTENAYIDNIKVTDTTPMGSTDVQAAAFSLYPNPASDILNIDNAGIVIDQVTITDMNGRIVAGATPNSNTATLNVGSLASGVYMAKVTAGGQQAVKKVVIK